MAVAGAEADDDDDDVAPRSDDEGPPAGLVLKSTLWAGMTLTANPGP